MTCTKTLNCSVSLGQMLIKSVCNYVDYKCTLDACDHAVIVSVRIQFVMLISMNQFLCLTGVVRDCNTHFEEKNWSLKENTSTLRIV